MRWDLIGLAGLVIGILGVGVSLWIYDQSNKKIVLAQCEAKDRVLMDATVARDQAWSNQSTSKKALQVSNPEGLNGDPP